MRYARLWANRCWMATALLLASCGGGGTGTSTSGDIFPSAARALAQATGLDRFLLFPNPQVRADGVFEVGAPEYAKAYYEAIDPQGAKDTVAKWKATNNIGVTTPGHAERQVTFGDQRDLGYGRRMTAHQSPDGTMAFLVENYQVGAYGDYTPQNLEAAVNRVSQWHLGTNAIEFSPGPNGPADASFVKFYSFDPVSGARLAMGSLDGRPAKAMPTICISCHGGRGDPLTPPDASGKQLFPLVMNSYSQHRGDVQAKLHPFEPATFDYSPIAGFTRAALEPDIKAINKMVLCSYPLPFGTNPATLQAEDQCRRIATRNEYQGTAAAQLKDMYGGTGLNGLPNPATATIDAYVEASWAAGGQSSLYLNVQAPACRVCHRLLGTGNQSEIGFETFAHFDAYKDRIKAHVVDRGNMPLAKLIYDKFWSTPSMFQTMATYLLGAGYPDGALMPGRPIADPGPDRVVLPGPTPLSAAMSLYASDYQWTLLSGPAGATLVNPTSAQPTFTAMTNGVYVLQLVASRAGATSASAQLKIVVDNTLPYTPSALRFTDIKTTVLQGGGGQCTTCHQANGNGTVIPPIWYTSYDRSGTGNASTNDHWFYTELRGRINFTDVVASPVLRKPSNHHHNGGLGVGFDDSLVPGAAGRANYDKVLNWILNGAPE